VRLWEDGFGLTVGFYSPLPPARTGVADYADTLLAELRRFGQVEVSPRHSTIPLYHLGNNSLHAGIYRRALEEPGVVVLHDAVLNHFLLGQLNERDYIDEFVYNYGEWNRGLGQDLWRGRAASGSDSRFFAWPMLRRVAETARAVVVHNPAAALAVAQHAPAVRVVEIPHLFAMPCLPGDAAVLRFRQHLGIEPGTFVFGIFGYLRESKRLSAALAAFEKVRNELPSTALLVAGSFASTDLERATLPLLSSPGVVRLPYLPEREFWYAAGAVDACLNLRYPSTGETSGISIRLMGIGKPVMMTDSPECARFPEDACLRIDSGAAERDSLHDHMILVTSMTGLARAIGLRGARHIAAHHRVDEVSKQYWELLCELST
jgi:glycosyltransferase involved in cell wall biosynthesis